MTEPVRLYPKEPSFLDKHLFEIKVLMFVLSIIIVVAILYSLVPCTYGYLSY